MKLQSLYDTILDCDADVALICETWMKSDNNYNRIKEEIENDKKLNIFAYNRPGKKRGGGVCIIADPQRLKLVENKFTRNGLEIISARGKIIGRNRDIVIYCLYLPPNLGIAKAKLAKETINEDISRIKSELSLIHI